MSVETLVESLESCVENRKLNRPKALVTVREWLETNIGSTQEKLLADLHAVRTELDAERKRNAKLESMLLAAITDEQKAASIVTQPY